MYNVNLDWVAAIGQDIVNNLFDVANLLGKDLRMEINIFMVIGKGQQNFGRSADDFIFTPFLLL